MSFVGRCVESLNSLYGRFVFFVVISLISIGLPYLVFSLTSDPYARIFVSIIAAAILLLGFKVATWRSISENRIRLAVLSGTATIFVAILNTQSQQHLVLNGIIKYINTQGLKIPGIEADDAFTINNLTAALLFAWILVAYLVLRTLSITPAMGEPDKSISDVLPTVTNLDRIQILKQSLLSQLDQLDHVSRWNDANYVPLQAEVQILEGKASRRRIVDLLKALRRDQASKIFVVLGDPGTGKSVAMRKLARDLLASSSISDRIPIYVNLKEWRHIENWSPESPPTSQDFHDFVQHNLLQTLDWNSQSFLLESDNYRKLLEAGFFFFIFDSFDEIPAVLDHEENSWLIQELSNCIVNYALGGRNTRAVIASRLFRKPKIVHHLRSVLEIRPFSDDRIVQAIDTAANDPRSLKRIILVERRDLGSIARNPFLLNLIINHVNAKKTAPASQAEMFDTFFETNLTLARSAYGLRNISNTEVYQICEDIAELMFNSPNVGLEIADSEILRRLGNQSIPEVLRFLAQARIARIANISGTFSFSHRRFNEFFLVRRILSQRTNAPYDAIQADSRWRDALVLYAEIAPEPEARQMAKHAWGFAKNLADVSLGVDRQRFLEARHALRFLIEGFRNRQELIRDIHEQLARIIFEKLRENSDYIEKKTVVEAIGLLSLQRSQRLILSTLRRYPGWISEQAGAAARYLPKISLVLSTALVENCINRPGFEGIREARRQEPIFALSDSFSEVARSLKLFRWNFYKSCAALALVVAISAFYRDVVPALYFCSAISYLLLLLILQLFMAHTPANSSARDVTARTLNRITSALRSILPSFGASRNALKQSLLFGTAHSVLSFVLFFIGVMLSTHLYSSKPAYMAFGIARTHAPHEIVLIAICIVGAISFEPTFWISVNRILRRFRITRLAPFIAISVISFGVMIAIGELLQLLVEYIELNFPEHAYLLRIAGYFILFAFVGWPFIYLAFPYLFDLAIDFYKLRGIKRHFSPDRSDISRDFLLLKTAAGRSRYIDYVETASFDYLEQMKNNSNVWPDGKRPQIVGDLASVRLAQLDARWLDLD